VVSADGWGSLGFRRDGGAIVISNCNAHLLPWLVHRDLPRTGGGRWTLVIEHTVKGCVTEWAEIVRRLDHAEQPDPVLASKILVGGRAELEFERRDDDDPLYVSLSPSVNEDDHVNQPGCQCGTTRITSVRVSPR
jgi:hypothetical protein